MATLTPRELAIRDRIEALIRLLEPGLDLVLAVGDRVSRLVDRDDDWDPPSTLASRPSPSGPGTAVKRDPLDAAPRPGD